MAAVGKGGGRRKVFWNAVCQRIGGAHGKAGYKSTHGWFFVGMGVPKHFKKHKQPGCPECRIARGGGG